MGRFSHLEFNREEEDQSSLAHPEVKKDEKYYLGLAEDRFHEGRFENALRFYSRALEYDARVPEAWLGQIQALIELDEPQEARVWADKGLEQFPHHPEMQAAKGVAAARLGEYDQAMAHSDAALAEKGTSAYRWRARGEVLLCGNDRNADFCFGKALTAAPQDWFEPLAIGRVYLYHEKCSPALRYLDIAVSRNSQSAFAWETLGACREKIGMRAPARQAFQQAVDLDPQRGSAREALGRLEHVGVWGALIARLKGMFGRS